VDDREHDGMIPLSILDGVGWDVIIGKDVERLNLSKLCSSKGDRNSTNCSRSSKKL